MTLLDASWPPPGATLVLGGARSGKSRCAEMLVQRRPSPWHYVATAEALDGEMVHRIELHRQRRGAGWRTLEAPLDLPAVLERLGQDPAATILVDCLTLWVSNLLLAEQDCVAPFAALDAALAQARGRVVLVSNEVGLGIVPDNALSRTFRDRAGQLNQQVAGRAAAVAFVAAGLPLVLKAPA